jgi:AsmA protein
VRRLGRIILVGLGIALVATGVATAWFVLTFDPNAYRDRVATLVRDATGRELAIEGNLSVTVIPRLGIRIGATRLAQPPGFGPTPFATLSEAEADLRLWPLVRHRRLEIGQLRVQGVALELTRRSDGTTNWADLSNLPSRHDATAGGAPSSIQLSETDVDDVRVHYVDHRGHAEYELRDGSVRVENLGLAEPFTFSGRFRLEHDGRTVQVHAHGAARFDGARSFELMQPVLTLGIGQGATRDALTIEVATPVLRYAASTLRVDAPQAQVRSRPDSSVQVSGSWAAQSITVTQNDAVSIVAPTLALDLEGENVPGGRVRLELQTPSLAGALAAQTLSAENLRIETGDLKLRASVSGTRIFEEPQLAGHLTFDSFSPRRLLEAAGQRVDAEPAALARADLSAQYRLSATALRLHNVNLTLDDTNITGEIVLSDLARPRVRFDLAADRLELDRYTASSMIGSAPGGGGFELSSDALSALDVEGVLRVAELTVRDLHASDVVLSVNGPGPAADDGTSDRRTSEARPMRRAQE